MLILKKIIKNINLKFLIKIIVLIALVNGTLFVYQKVNRYLTTKKDISVETILLGGQYQYLSPNDIQNVVSNTIKNNNFFNVDIFEIQKNIKKIPWIKNVNVRKIWQNKLIINIVEHEIVSTWNDATLLAVDGQIIDVDKKNVSPSMVNLSGVDEQSLTVLENYYTFSSIFKDTSFKIINLELTDRSAWKITLDNKIMLILGKDNGIARIKKFLSIYNKLNLNKISYIDLRYDTGVAIGWKTSN